MTLLSTAYRAWDTKLKRDVAIKILPDEFARDEDRVSRFQREAELLASLNHPNIGAIYDVEEANGLRYLNSRDGGGRDTHGTTEARTDIRVRMELMRIRSQQ